jgi:hypothetical protein
MFNMLRHRRLAWIPLVLSLWLGVFSSYALSMQARMQTSLAFAAASAQEMPCPDHQAAQVDSAPHDAQASQQDHSHTHDCPICHVISSGWVQTPATTLANARLLHAAPSGRLFQAVEYQFLPSTPPPNA